MADRVDFEVKRDRTFTRSVAVKLNGAPVDLTGWTLRFVARVRAGDAGTPIVDKSVAMDSDGVSTITLTAAETAALTAGRYPYDVHRRNGAEAVPMFEGLLIVEDVVGGA